MTKEIKAQLLKNIRNFKRETSIHVTTSHTGKMQDMLSLSTSCTVNPFCKARMQNARSICAHCYADAMQARYAGLRAALVKNSEILSSSLIDVEKWPDLCGLEIFRLESFGDLINVNHARNFIRFCKRNLGTTFALWTKNPNLMESAYRLEGGKPSNLVVNLSSELVNIPRDVKTFDVDRIFTVYDKKHAPTVTINCGARNCNTCRRCYQHGGETVINELLK